MDLLLAAARDIAPGDPLDPDTTLGAMVDETQTERVLGYIETGRDEGADLVLGGSRVRADTGGFYIEPTVFDGVRNDMRIAREEIFGPVLATIDVRLPRPRRSRSRTTRSTASPRRCGRDSVDAAHRVARAIRAGIVWVNTFDAGDITSPFGGFKQSGIRPRQVDPRAREVRRPEDGLDRVARLAAGQPGRPLGSLRRRSAPSDRSARAVHHLTGVQVTRPRGDVAR